MVNRTNDYESIISIYLYVWAWICDRKQADLGKMKQSYNESKLQTNSMGCRDEIF